MKKKQKGTTLVELLTLIVYIAALIGWVWNIVKIFHIVDDPITGVFILRVVGIFVAPLGAILGYF